MGRVVSPTPTPLSSGRVVPALVASYDMHGRAVGLFYTQPTGQLKTETSNFVLNPSLHWKPVEARIQFIPRMWFFACFVICRVPMVCLKRQEKKIDTNQHTD